jgi:tetratricopeptide (TPR) repeat protein
MRKYAGDMLEQENWQEAITAADALIQLVPEDFGDGSGYQLKATALRKLKREEEELAVLRTIAEHDSSAMPVFLRLIEVDVAKQDWPQVLANARRATALNPFLRSPQQALGEAGEAAGQVDEAVAAYRKVLILDPSGAAMTHFKLAKLLKEKDNATAKRHLLDSLALAPRFREGHEMLREWK